MTEYVDTTNWPHHIQPSTEIVGPLLNFKGRPVPVRSTPPNDTRDPRYEACWDHHTACDCREAHLGEIIREYRHEYQLLRDAILAEVEGHATWVYESRYSRRPDLECQCMGCRLARRTGLRDHRSRSNNTRYLKGHSREF